MRPRPSSFPGPLPRPRCPPRVGEAGPADTLPPVPERHPGLLSSGDAPPSGQTCTASRLPARVADAAVMHQAGAAVADRSASLRVQGGPSGPHFPPAAYRFIYDGPGLGAPHQPPRGGPRGHRVVGGIPAQLERAGFLPTTARRCGGTRVCYRRERGRAWRGVRSDMAYAAWPPPSALIMSLSWSCCRGGRRPLLGRGMSCHTDSPAHGQHAGGAGFDAGHVYVPPHVACAPGFPFPCPAARAFASGARAGLPGY